MRMASRLDHKAPLKLEAMTKMLMLASLAVLAVGTSDEAESEAVCVSDKPVMKGCGAECFGNSDLASCSADCLEQKGESSVCAQCFGPKIQCSIEKCMDKCSDEYDLTGDCQACVMETCNFAASCAPGACVSDQPVMKGCGKECVGTSDLASCSADCLEQKGESSVCAQCFGPKIQCSIEKCMDKCGDEFDLTGDCQACVMETCNFAASCAPGKSAPAPVDASFLKELVALAKAKNPVVEPASVCMSDKPVMKGCGAECFGNSDLASCSADCLEQKGESSVCAQCFGPKIQCSIEKCMDKCSDEYDLTGDCQACVMETCNFAASCAPGACVSDQPVMKGCGKECVGTSDLASCSADCLEQKGESSVCAQCFGPKIQCSIEKCMDKCGDEFDLTGDCQACVMETCNFAASCALGKSAPAPVDASFLKELVALAKAKDPSSKMLYP